MKPVCIMATDPFNGVHCKYDAEFLRPFSSFLVNVMFVTFQDSQSCIIPRQFREMQPCYFSMTVPSQTAISLQTVMKLCPHAGSILFSSTPCFISGHGL